MQAGKALLKSEFDPMCVAAASTTIAVYLTLHLGQQAVSTNPVEGIGR